MKIVSLSKSFLTLLFLFIWLSLGPLHLSKHSDHSGSECEICYQISHQNLVVYETSLSLGSMSFIDDPFKLIENVNCANYKLSSYFLRPPPIGL